MQDTTTAGDVYTLTCNTTVVKNLAAKPDIQWLYSGTTVDGTSITLGAVVMTRNVFTRNLTFNPLRTSHGGQYICRASVDIPAISLPAISSQSSLNITVQSKNMRLLAHKCLSLQHVHVWIYDCDFLFFLVPINVTIRRIPSTDVLSAGINLTLICTIQLNTAVDTNVVVNTSWTGPNAMFASTNRISITDVSESVTPYKTTVLFSPLNITDSGNYTCQADIRPNPSSSFIMMNRETATHTITVGSECK